MSPTSRTRKRPKPKRRERPEQPSRRRRFLRERRSARIAIWVAIVFGYAAIMWYLVFPWVDRNFVNRPAL